MTTLQSDAKGQLAFLDLSEKKRPGRGRTVIPFRFPGGKFYALSALRQFWNAMPHDEYREPFMGGGAVFFAKELTKFNWINDIDPELINTYKVMAKLVLREQLIKMVSAEIANKERWKEIRAFTPSNDLERAFRFYYLNRTSFSGKMISAAWGYRPKRSLPPERWVERIGPCGKKLARIKITCGDFEPVIRAKSLGKKTLLFVDPPYFNPPKRKHYVNGFQLAEHRRLAQLLRKTEHAFILTYEDIEVIRDMYKWAHFHSNTFYYRVDNSSENGDSVPTGKRRKSAELIITNFEVS